MSATAIPLAMVVSVGGLLLLCRPYLEASRPVASIALMAGMILGPSITGLVPAPVISGLEPLYSLAAGWLVLGIAASWDIGSLRRLRAIRSLPLLAIAGAVPAALSILWSTVLVAEGPASFPAALILLAAIAVGLDPAAARAALLVSPRPDISLRRAPGFATLAVGCALAACAFVPPAAGTLRPADLLVRAGGAVTVGVALGVVFVALMRLAEGKGALLALLVAVALLGQGLANHLGLSPLAVLFVAGVILANDGARREMLGTILQELGRPFHVAVLLLAGAAMPFDRYLHDTAMLLAMTATFVLARSLVWALIGKAGPGLAALPFSPLVLVIALQAGSPGGWWHTIAAAITLAFIISEAVWIGSRRR